MKLLLGTSNKGKIQEIRDALADLHLEIVTPSDCGITEKPEEKGKTYEQNAIQKARFYFEKSGLPTLADDSGIIVEALKNELGIHTRRWGAGPEASDQEWIEFFLEKMLMQETKKAKFVCALCYIDQKGKEHLFEGTCDGVITEELEAEYLPGLPISACFKPDGEEKVFSALSVEEKNRISHRGRALHELLGYLSLSLI